MVNHTANAVNSLLSGAPWKHLLNFSLRAVLLMMSLEVSLYLWGITSLWWTRKPTEMRIHFSILNLA